MAKRIQPSREARVNVTNDDTQNAVDETDEVDDIQQKLRDLLGSDSDDDMDYTPHMVECELSDKDDDKDYKKKSSKREISETVGYTDLLNYTPTSADEDEASTPGDFSNDTKPMDDNTNNDTADLSDDSQIVFKTHQPEEVVLPKKIPKKFNRKNPYGMSPEVYLRDLKCLPTDLKKSMDRLHPAHFFYSKKGVKEAQRDQALQELIRMVPQDDPEAACSLVVELMKRPTYFWKVHFVGWNYEVEEVGLICIQILERLISSKKLFLEMILKVGKVSTKWRFKNCLNSKMFKFIPKTMTKCAQILLEEGDVKGLEELFEDFRSNLRNVSGEKTLVLYRCVSAMLEKKKFDESSDAISLGGTSFGTSFTNKSSGPHPDTIISEVKTALKDKRDVDWLMPLFSWYVMDEKSADEVKDMLTEYRNENVDHLPAHQHLLEFLFQEYEDETEILLEELKVFSEQFPWDGSVLTYCKLLVKKGEDDDLDDSFDSNEENQNSKSEEKLGKSEEKLEKNIEVFEITVKFLDYEMNKDDQKCWDLLAESLKLLRSSHKETRFINVSFGDRGGWWVDQNFKDLEHCDTNVLVKKGVVAVCLYGKECEKYLQVLGILEKRNHSFPSSSLANLLKELQTSAESVGSPCLEPFQIDFSGVERRWNLKEWRKIEHIETFVKMKKNKNYYGKGNY